MVSQVIVQYLKSCGHFLWWTFVGDPDSLYADDIALILENIAQLPSVLKDIGTCGQYMGLSLNLDKTMVFDSRAQNEYKYCGVKVTNIPVCIGMHLGVGEASVELNFQKAIEKMRTVALQWQK